MHFIPRFTSFCLPNNTSQSRRGTSISFAQSSLSSFNNTQNYDPDPPAITSNSSVDMTIPPQYFPSPLSKSKTCNNPRHGMGCHCLETRRSQIGRNGDDDKMRRKRKKSRLSLACSCLQRSKDCESEPTLVSERTRGWVYERISRESLL